MSSTKSSAWASGSNSRQVSPEKSQQLFNHKRIRRIAPYAFLASAPFVLYGAYKGIKHIIKPSSASQSKSNVNFSRMF